MFLQAKCDAVLVVEEFNLQNDGWWDNLLNIKAPDKQFFYKGTFYDLSEYCKCVLLIGNSAVQGGRVATAVETHCFLVECKSMNLQDLVQKAMPNISLFDDANRTELQRWACGLRENAVFAKSSYGLTLRDLAAVVFEALHVGVSIEVAGRNLRVCIEMRWHCVCQVATALRALSVLNQFAAGSVVGIWRKCACQFLRDCYRKPVTFSRAAGAANVLADAVSDCAAAAHPTRGAQAHHQSQSSGYG
jgi:hypothetical protein